MSWYQFAQAIFDEAVNKAILDKQPVLKPLETKDYPTPAKRPANSRLDCTKILKEFGIQPSNWMQAIQNIAAYKSN